MAISNTNPSSSPTTPFPPIDGTSNPNPSASPPSSPTHARRARGSTNASTASGRIMSASIKLMEANPPPGMWAATGSTASKAPSLSDIRRGSFGSDGWNDDTQRARASSRTSQEEKMRSTRRTSATTSPMEGSEPFPAVTEEPTREQPSYEAERETPRYEIRDKTDGTAVELRQSNSITEKTEDSAARQPLTADGQYANGYVPPPKLPWKRSFAIGAKGFWKWFCTPAGFLITLYGLNVVAWGGMLFLLLCNAAPAMCKPSCDAFESPRRIWIEIDSQVLNALFCVTGFGLAPWRFRDLYWWGFWRIGGSKRKEIGIRRLAGIHRGWFRLPGSEQLHELADAKTVDPEDPAIPIPTKYIPDPPPTGIRAPATKSWKMDFVVWNNAWNTFFQVVLCYFMYNYDRRARPSWATGTFVALGCIVAGIAGIVMWHEGKNIKKVEGVPEGRRDYQNTRRC
ncbi:hypothetical protein EK21DRAFT_86280 [Setomelanomma holmii]|uniref:Uncharacterized protein n=1 Tax=Setomelanomma holmii TaxID=210430 RepID=A0A9P4HHR9_9PLEO|nr:hypothetical protein EK21DRAFT_86280 [Setomelanomma holmii]